MTPKSLLLTVGLAFVLAAVSVPLVLGLADAKPQIQFTELYPFESNGKWGYFDRTGREIVAPRFDHADYFHGLGLVELDGMAGYINDQGEFVIKPTYTLDPNEPNDVAARPFWEGLAAVRVNGAWGYINLQGDWQIVPKFIGEDGFDTVGDFSDGRAWFRRAVVSPESGEGYEAYGFIDATGEVALEPKWLAVNDFGEGLAGAVHKGYWGFIDRDGEFQVRPKFDGVGVFHNGLAPAKKDGLWGYLNRRGQWHIEPTFVQADNFLDGVAPVQTEDGWGYLDPYGQWIIPPRFDRAFAFENGLARVVVDGEILYIDHSGNQFFP
ncbi:MAG: WG repeat-containing protein [Planctomycetota bacterium]